MTASLRASAAAASLNATAGDAQSLSTPPLVIALPPPEFSQRSLIPTSALRAGMTLTRHSSPFGMKLVKTMEKQSVAAFTNSRIRPQARGTASLTAVNGNSYGRE